MWAWSWSSCSTIFLREILVCCHFLLSFNCCLLTQQNWNFQVFFSFFITVMFHLLVLVSWSNNQIPVYLVHLIFLSIDFYWYHLFAWSKFIFWVSLLCIFVFLLGYLFTFIYNVVYQCFCFATVVTFTLFSVLSFFNNSDKECNLFF